MTKRRLLIADDEEGIRESLDLILGESYELEFAIDGEEALNKLKKNSYALTLLDIKMPKLDGLEVLRCLQMSALKNPVIMLTAYQSVELAKEAVKYGVLDYLPKPFEREAVLKSVKNAIIAAER